MRILHTSDWHLGQTLHQHERRHEHERFLDWLLDTLEAERVDALLVAGDVYDNTNPSAASQRQLYRFLQRARERVPQLEIVLTAGNHDSPGRVEAPQPLLSPFGAVAIGHAADTGRLVVPLKDASGAVGAWCIAMPFLRASDLPPMPGSPDTYRDGMAARYREAFEIALQRRQPGQAIVAMGHCHIGGAQVSEESERRLVVGGSQALPVELFDPGIAYVALGHLHLAQAVGGDATRRYCGSPLPMSFSETAYPHQVLLVEIEGESVSGVKALRVPRTVELLRVPRQPQPLEQALAELAALDLPDRPEAERPYLQVRIRLDRPEPGLRARVEAALADKPVRLVKIETTSARAAAGTEPPLVTLDELARLAPEDFFCRLYRHRHGSEPPADLKAAFDELLALPGDDE